jgi:hypothetical protein
MELQPQRVQPHARGADLQGHGAGGARSGRGVRACASQSAIRPCSCERAGSEAHIRCLLSSGSDHRVAPCRGGRVCAETRAECNARIPLPTHPRRDSSTVQAWSAADPAHKAKAHAARAMPGPIPSNEPPVGRRACSVAMRKPCAHCTLSPAAPRCPAERGRDSRETAGALRDAREPFKTGARSAAHAPSRRRTASAGTRPWAG